MSAHQLRRAADLERLRALEKASRGRLKLLAADAVPGRPIRLEMRCRTAADARYPVRAVVGVSLRIDLPARYPFERPVVTIESPIFHPNVFANGLVCQGERWLPAEGLDLLVKRMIRLASFDPAHVNPASPANRAAASWYLAQVARTPEAFPTDRVEWDTDRVIRPCPACGKSLRLPAGRRGRVNCPSCSNNVEVQT
ncbi:MAG: ubiquitin-conjugating enzyme E2 [Candidatus Methylophosphatis roskildensis]